MLTLQQRIYLVKCYGIGDVSYQYAINLFHQKYPDVAVTKMTLKKLIAKFDETGSVVDKKKIRKVYNENDAVTIMALQSVEDNPRLSLRQRAAELTVSHTLLQTIFKRNKIYPFKPKFRHTLEIQDHALRLDFCLWIGEKLMENRNFHKRILFSDECTFSTNGVVSSQNCRFWSRDNPNFKINTRNQRYRKVNVWCGMLINKIIGPYFFDENLNQHSYLSMLRNFLIPSLQDVNLENIYYQQDGCPAHSTLLVRAWLDQQFPERWIGRYGSMHWPARSPDLSPMDFFLWGHLKQKVYAEPVGNNVEILKQRITAAVREVNLETLGKVYMEFRNRAERCATNGGDYVE
jgi:hypothetical protein